MSRVGTRVGAIQSSNEDNVYFYGYGVYVGDCIHPEMGFPNPCIKLDTGKIVWGVECWWGPEDRMKEKLKDVTEDQLIMVEGSENDIEDQLTDGGG